MKNEYHIIGAMSGTSLDELDLALIFFKKENNQWTYQIKQSETIAYSDNWIFRLKKWD